VYGTIPTEVPAKVETSLNGDNLYHQSKIAAERMVHDYAEKGLGTIIIRPTVTYASGDTGFPGTLVRMVRAHRLLLSPSDVRIHLLDASALAEMIYLIVCKDRLKSNVFIAADKRPVLLKDLVDQIHNHFYHTPYPSYLKMPRVFFDAMALVFRVFKSEKWLVRIQLISKSWYYDINETLKSGIDFRPAKTETSFIQKMCECSEN
jgi:nucleoside-diphosphate-sugar epimerase